MKNNELEISYKDMETLKNKTVELLNSLDTTGDVTESLIAYCVSNGCSEEDARKMITENIIPVVNEYNTGCRAIAGSQDCEWLLAKVSERVEEMTMTEEYNYKVALIRAIRMMDREVLDQVGLLNGEAWEAEYHEICDDKNDLAEGQEVSEELLASVNQELADAIANSTGALQTCEALNKLIDDFEGEDSVKMFVTNLWQDERMKYCFAAVACVAKNNNELDSVPADMDDKILTVQCCKAVDVQNLAAKAACGEFTLDHAYSLLKTVTMVAAGVVAVYAVVKLATVAVTAIAAVCTAVFGTGLLAVAIKIAMSIGTGLLMGKGMSAGLEILGKVMDVTYNGLKAIGKGLCNLARKTVIPALVSGFERVRSFWARRKEKYHRRHVVYGRV